MNPYMQGELWMKLHKRFEYNTIGIKFDFKCIQNWFENGLKSNQVD